MMVHLGQQLEFMNTARTNLELAGAGIQTSALAFGGYNPSNTTATEDLDGTNWTKESGNLATARRVI